MAGITLQQSVMWLALRLWHFASYYDACNLQVAQSEHAGMIQLLAIVHTATCNMATCNTAILNIAIEYCNTAIEYCNTAIEYCYLQYSYLQLSLQ